MVKARAFCIENPRICVWCWHAVRTFLWVINLAEAPPRNRKEQQKSKTKCHIIYYCAMHHSPPARPQNIKNTKYHFEVIRGLDDRQGGGGYKTFKMKILYFVYVYTHENILYITIYIYYIQRNL